MAKTTIEGFENWSKWIGSLGGAVKKEAAKEVIKTSEKISSDAKWSTPVDTGRLEASITAEFDKSTTSAEIFTDVEYALAVELGTTKQEAQPYMIPAFNKHSKGFEKRIKAITEKEMK